MGILLYYLIRGQPSSRGSYGSHAEVMRKSYGSHAAPSRLRRAMPGYAGLCWAMPGYAGLCRATPGYAGLRQATPGYPIYAGLRQAIRWAALGNAKLL